MRCNLITTLRISDLPARLCIFSKSAVELLTKQQSKPHHKSEKPETPTGGPTSAQQMWPALGVITVHAPRDHWRRVSGGMFLNLAESGLSVWVHHPAEDGQPGTQRSVHV